MVSVAHFRADAENLLYEIERRCNEKEKNADDWFVAARLAQRIFRGYITRKYIELINEKAIYIQKNWRAFQGRIKYEELLEKKYQELCTVRYEEATTTIQKIWKGYLVRSRIFSFFKLKSWLEFVNLQNIRLKSMIKKHRAVENNFEANQREKESKEWIAYILFKLHHLLRTHQISGIYSLPKTSSLSDIEKMLKGLRYKDFMTFYNAYKADVHEQRTKKMPPFILQNCKKFAHYEKEWYEHKLVHKDSYTEPSLSKDRYTRYELPERFIEKERDDVISRIPQQFICCCSFCTKNTEY